MLSTRWLPSSLRPCLNRHSLLSRSFCASRIWRDAIPSSPRVNYDDKYAEKLKQRAEERGKSVEELKGELKEQERQRRIQKLAEAANKAAEAEAAAAQTTSDGATSLQSSPKSASSSEAARRDSSPVKPLSTILNLQKLLETPHTPEQISLLWRAYHESRSNGTGRGFLCASVPVESYEKMVGVARKYPTFVLPVPRENAQGEPAPDGSASDPAYEFYLMEWSFHGAPPDLAAAADPFANPRAAPGANPQTSTVLFTPLQEYKLRQAFATPYLVLTQYTDLVRSHGLVLLRGEITPGSASAGGDAGRFMLSQQDAQLLAVHMQRFYLWHEGSAERAQLLRTFHEDPTAFKWEELLKHTDFA
ncbi:ATP11-domain-containing protein [Epithele typhae]|uniref:ATP11-domain-containing protein n=1 Tax=Epithele typhae TaxID=378194 RepID=UPI002007945B|nr:ATP11-domain-containing protein [Epithele typhae]KAH9927494.1 ATP11-domain-containing protein [Epithele typhae]